MRLIDVDAFRKEYNLAERCKECPRYMKRDCDQSLYSARDFCGWLDDAPVIDVPGWISVKDRLPVEDGKYLAVCKSILPGTHDRIETVWFMKDLRSHCQFQYEDGIEGPGFYQSGEDGDWIENVTHWMPLPNTDGLNGEGLNGT